MKRRDAQRGYALLTVMFLAATMVLVAMAAAFNVATEGRRVKEDELEWRGNQYVRAIRLYYRKNGRFPQTIDDLTKHDIGQPRFLRKNYKDPMNKQDGSWRFIYVTPGGQLVGSVMHQALGQSGPGGASAIAGLFGGQAGAGANGAAAGANGTTPAAAGANPGATTTGFGASSTPNATNSTAAGGAGTGSSSGLSAIESSTPGSTNPTTGDQNGITGPVLGGNLIGVASKIKKPSIRVYEQGTTYFQWEFIWDPTKTTPIGGAAPTQPNGTQPNGQAPANGTQPTNGAPPNGTPPAQNGQQGSQQNGSQQSQIQQ